MSGSDEEQKNESARESKNRQKMGECEGKWARKAMRLSSEKQVLSLDMSYPPLGNFPEC
jgi:hypothetical protein